VKQFFKIGDVFGRLTIVELLANNHKNTNRRARVVCRCGNELIVARYSLRSGNTMSCGCLQSERAAEVKTKHGHARSPTYISWLNMKTRCLNSNYAKHHRYSGRGIKIYPPWIESFEVFLADMGERRTGTTLDRYPDNNGNYEPGNCRWATPKEQAQNKTQNNKRG